LNISLRTVRDSLMSVVEEAYRVGFAVAGRIARPAVRHWSSPGGERVLAIAPHPDDECIGCAGTLLRHRASGDRICIAFVTDGRGSRALGLQPEEMARRRHLEASAAVRLLGAERMEWFGLSETDWQTEMLRRRLAAVIADFNPSIIYAPSQVDFHPDHRRAATALGLALQAAGGPVRVRAYQVQVPLTSILTNVVTDIDDVLPETASALDVYVTQRDSVVRAIRQRRYSAAFYGFRRQAEEFWELPGQQYAALHARTTGAAEDTFRGIRWHTWTDPYAYLRGRAMRKMMARPPV
jgi:LmbE family N-acetylglucosaminyl deacetylase